MWFESISWILVTGDRFFNNSNNNNNKKANIFNPVPKLALCVVNLATL